MEYVFLQRTLMIVSTGKEEKNLLFKYLDYGHKL